MILKCKAMLDIKILWNKLRKKRYNAMKKVKMKIKSKITWVVWRCPLRKGRK